ncbi:hypothetical protein KIL84_001972 [Mauremys mutica]|uniref:Uncharacterized protein n=1 Tax=Mauremys mutica TaxID=74926 RepID=A0A9D3XJF9_9SAUR|nr:hypothetical protein KIL84_001972 [Mauremys mutica]
MAWALWLALWVLGGPGARGCLRCDPGSMRLLRELKGPYLGRQLRGDPGLRARLEALLERSLQGLAELPIGEQSYMGVIDGAKQGFHPSNMVPRVDVTKNNASTHPRCHPSKMAPGVDVTLNNGSTIQDGAQFWRHYKQ